MRREKKGPSKPHAPIGAAQTGSKTGGQHCKCGALLKAAVPQAGSRFWVRRMNGQERRGEGQALERSSVMYGQNKGDGMNEGESNVSV